MNEAICWLECCLLTELLIIQVSSGITVLDAGRIDAKQLLW